MSVQACVLTFIPTPSVGTQTITGVVDQDGAPFIGKVFLFQSCFAVLDTVTAGSTFIGGYSDSRGADNLTIRAASGVNDTYSGFNFKALSVMSSQGVASLVSMWTTNFSQAFLEREAKVSAARSGEFDVLYTLSNITGDTVFVTVLGGDDLDISFATNHINGTYTVPSKPQGLLSLPLPNLTSSGSTGGSTGGENVSWGFATRDGVYGTSVLNVANQGNNFSAQRTDGWTSSIDPATGAQSSRPTISAWDDTSFTIANGGTYGMPMVFCGENVACTSGSFTQPITTGEQVITLGIDARWVFLCSTGYPTDTVTQQPVGQFSMGWLDGTRQVGFWSGEQRAGNTSPIYGARYLSESTVLRFGTPNGASTTFDAVATVTDLDASGTMTLDWTSADSTAREVLWFAIGEAAGPTPPPSFTTRRLIRRRVRRAPVVWSEKGGFPVRITVNNFYLDLQPGVGNRDAPDPQVMIRASKDGGRTWGNERMMSAGRVGEYFKRVNAWRWGSGRAWVFEVSVSDSAVWNLINAYIDAEPGDS